MRNFLQGHVRNVEISKVIHEIMSYENVLSCWSIICTLETTKSDKLLSRIAEMWVTLRGFSYVGNLVEQYKASMASSKGKKVLRKTLKQLSQD